MAAVLCVPASAASFTRGFVDDVWFDPPTNGISIPQWIGKTQATGARFISIEVDWAGFQPTPPSGRVGLSSSGSGAFSRPAMVELDRRIEEFTNTGLQPLLLITDAPRWAEGSGGTPAEYATGGYRPNPVALGNFAHALAQRYSGNYPDPLHPGARLPHVRYYQAWAEAEMDPHLSPQWTRMRGRWVNTGALIYRSMLNEFYAGIKAGDRSSKVVTSGFAPYGDPPGGQRTHPITFLRNVLCLNAKLHRSCRAVTHFDILASDPYEVSAPTQHAFSSQDASAPDLGRFTRLVKAAVRAHTLPRGRRPLWVTEFGYDSNPPNRAAVSLQTQAHWLEQAFYIFWREGVSNVFWYLVRDQAPPYTINYASGVYFGNGVKKPSFTAYHFPLVVMRNGRRAQIWGLAPARGRVTVQHRVRGHWRAVARFNRAPGAVFSRWIGRNQTGYYRATLGRQRSLVWRYR